MMRSLTQAILLMCAGFALSACSCKEWGYCPHLFPDAERFSGSEGNQ